MKRLSVMTDNLSAGRQAGRQALLALLVAGLSACGSDNNGDDDLLGGPSSANTAPQARNVAVWGVISPPDTRSATKTTLQLTGDYYDGEADVADTHEFRWLKNGEVITGASASKLVLSSDVDLLAEYVGCVTPIAKTGVRRGEEVCAPASTDGSPTVPPGTPVPIANPTITGTPLVGSAIQSSYTYSPRGDAQGSAEGESLFSWVIYRDPSLPSIEACTSGAGVSCSYTVQAADEDKLIYSCVQPRNQLGVWGPERCDNTNAANNFAPELQDMAIWGAVQSGVTLTLSGKYYDVDGDAKDQTAITSSIRWYRRDSTGHEELQPQANGQTTFAVTAPAEGIVFKACATPFSVQSSATVIRQGVEVCTTTSDSGVVLPPNSPTPVATPSIDGTPLQGNTINARYTYDANVQSGQSAEGSDESLAQSKFSWFVGETGGVFTLAQACPTGANTPCALPVTNGMVGKMLKACVIPANQLGAFGPSACSEVMAIGVSLSGKLEYGETLTAHVVGLEAGTYHYQWKMNLNDVVGPTNDNLLNRTEVTVDDGGAGDNNTFTIGTLQLAKAQGADTSGDGIVTDSEWITQYPDSDWLKLVPTYTPGGPASSAGPKDANFFIGKDVTVCITGTQYGNDAICANASEQQDPDSAGVVCNDSNRCVTSGIYFDETAASPLVKRGVAPVAELSIASGAVFYRPLSYAESQLNVALGLGNDVANSVPYIDSPFTGITLSQNAIYFDGTNEVINMCRERGLAVPVHGFELPTNDADIEGDLGADTGSQYVLRNDLNDNPSPPGMENTWLPFSLGALFRERLAYNETFLLVDAADPYASYDYFIVSPTTGWGARAWGFAASSRTINNVAGTNVFYHALRRYLGVIPSGFEVYRGQYDVVSLLDQPKRYISIACVTYP